MKLLSARQVSALVATLGAITLAAYSVADVDPGAAAPAHYAWHRDPGEVIVSYRENWGELAEQDVTPLIRVFGDGRVLVHRPAYTKNAGDYELWLPPEELEDLLSSLLANGLATFEPRAVKDLKQSRDQVRLEAASKAQKPTEVFMVADAVTSVFELNLSAVSAGESRRKIFWPALKNDARNYPGVEPIQQLRAAELQLLALMERQDLARVR